MKVSDLLKGNVKKEEKEKKNTSTTVGTMYSEIILDASGSMSGAKYRAACEGINEELAQLRQEKSHVRTIVRVTEFEGDWNRQGVSCMKFSGPTLIESATFNPQSTGGSTPLYATVGYILNDLLNKMIEGDTAVVKIFTDGGENSSYGSEFHNPMVLKAKIEEAEKRGVIVTFIGTKLDIDNMVKFTGIKVGNTLSHNNTPESLANTFKMSKMKTSEVRAAYGVGGQSATRGYVDHFFTDPKDTQ